MTRPLGSSNREQLIGAIGVKPLNNPRELRELGRSEATKQNIALCSLAGAGKPLIQCGIWVVDRLQSGPTGAAHGRGSIGLPAGRRISGPCLQTSTAIGDFFALPTGGVIVPSRSWRGAIDRQSPR